MSFDFWFTLILFILLTVILVKEILKPEIAIFSTLILLIIGNVITVKEAFSGFSNEGMLTIALLFIVAGSLQTTGALEKLNNVIFGNESGSIPKILMRILFPVAGASAFLNNTPIVAMLVPSVKSWCEKKNISVSKLLIPISFATIMGGVCTLIGTSTNLIIHGLLIENGIAGFSFFELTLIGIPIMIVGILYLILFSDKLLPDRKAPIEELGEKTREFVIELKVTPEYEHIGKSIEDAGLRHLKGLYLFQIERNGNIIHAVKPEETIHLNDRMFFTGLPKTILELQKTTGLQLIKDPVFDLKHYDSDEVKTYEAVVSSNSVLLGQNARESNFRDKYGAVIIAIHRNGERIQKKIGNVDFKPGDTLLLLSSKNFKKIWYNNSSFSLISQSHEILSKPKWYSYFSLIIFITSILLAALNVIPLISALGIAAIILVLTRSISGEKALNLVDWKILLIIASSFGIAIGMEKSGVGDFFAGSIIGASETFGIIGILAGIYIVTAVYTNFITNNTAAVLMFPIAISAAASLNMNVHPFAVAIAIGASSSFATPISYQTNLMVYGPGGYKFKDFMRIGLPLQFIVGILSVLLIYYFYI